MPFPTTRKGQVRELSKIYPETYKNFTGHDQDKSGNITKQLPHISGQISVQLRKGCRKCP